MNLQNLKKVTIGLFLCLNISALQAQILGSLYFDGNSSYVEIPESPMNEIGSGDFTLEAWIKGNVLLQNTHPMIFSTRGNDDSLNDMLLFLHNEWGGSDYKMLCLQIGDFNRLVINNGSFNGSLLDNECHHIAVVRKGNKLLFYADGVLFGTTGVKTGDSFNLEGPLWIGRDRLTGNTFNGLISQCRVWNVARTDSEILQDRDVSLQGTETGLLAYWEMKEGSGQTLVDKVNQYPGQLGGTTGTDTSDPAWSDAGCIDATASSLDYFETILLEVYPNPTQDWVYVTHGSMDKLDLEVWDAVGRRLAVVAVEDNLAEIDFRSYPQGTYLLRIRSQEKTMVQKIIKVNQ